MWMPVTGGSGNDGTGTPQWVLANLKNTPKKLGADPTILKGDGFCLKRPDGPYSVGCVSQFVTCTRKVSHIMFCRDGLFYDERTRKCAPRWYASSCPGYSKERPQGIPSSFVPVAPEESKFCWGRPDGDYNIGCISCYITCSGGQAHAMECPAGLVLDEASNMCLGKAYVSVCGGMPTTTTPAPIITEPTPPPEIPVPEVGPCLYHQTGFFGLGCSPRYLVCVDGRPTYYNCPYGFTLHEEKRTCVPKCEIRKCGCRPRTTTTTTMAPIPPPEPTIPWVRPCPPHRSGFFALGCSPRFLVCVDGRPTYNYCGAGLLFDEGKGTCLPKREVKHCWLSALESVSEETGEAY
uniref:Chitin-binding type-2 domain-containing protein n=1 Tax=Ascaris lumbricoides TaxID=6252 RepID=A0A9J2PI41_ASCLU